MKDWIGVCLDYIRKHCPDDFEKHAHGDACGLGYYLQEHWHLSFDLETRKAAIKFECYPWWIPESFKKIAVQIAEDELLVALEILVHDIRALMDRTANYLGVPVNAVKIPSYLYDDLGMSWKDRPHLLGMLVERGPLSKISIENPDFCFLAAADFHA